MAALPAGLRQHIHRVEGIALEMARAHALNEDRVRLGALAHDIARATKGEELLAQAGELGIVVHPVEERLPVLLHGPVAAASLKLHAGLDDQEVYDAICWHSTAHANLGPVASVVYLADKLDPQKEGRYPFLPRVRELASQDLELAMLEFLQHDLVSHLERGALVHPDSLEARNELLLRQSSRVA